MEILEVIIQILFGIVLVIGFVFVVIYLVKKDETSEFVLTEKEYSVVGLFILPVTEIMFILSTIDNILVNDMPLVIFNLIFVVSIPIFIVRAIKIFKENK